MNPPMAWSPLETRRLETVLGLHRAFQGADYHRQLAFLHVNKPGSNYAAVNPLELELSLVLKKQELFQSLPRDDQHLYLRHLFAYWIIQHPGQAFASDEGKCIVCVTPHLHLFVRDLRIGAFNGRNRNWFRGLAECQRQEARMLLDHIMQNEAIRNANTPRGQAATSYMPPRLAPIIRLAPISSILNPPDEDHPAGITESDRA
ncbi:hypothetical protein F4779DRAFT_604943 [Xylariaceae sp. FL0662B]|nr:hypothetical protein F4779DRAFT_604943 [Xylariaceae sp. FL0662B]